MRKDDLNPIMGLLEIDDPMLDCDVGADGVMYRLLPRTCDRGSWGVRVVEVGAAELYGFASEASARSWVVAHARADHLRRFPHLRMAWALQRWREWTGETMSEEQAQRVVDRLCGDTGAQSRRSSSSSSTSAA